MNIANIRAGLKTNITGAIDDPKSGEPIEMTGYILTNPTPPCFEIDFPPDSYLFDVTHRRGTDEIELIVRGFVALNYDIEAQKILDTWLLGSGTGSVKAAIQTDRTLAGACDDLRVERVSGHRRFGSLLDPNVRYLGAEWHVRILGSGT